MTIWKRLVIYSSGVLHIMHMLKGQASCTILSQSKVCVEISAGTSAQA